VQRPEEFSIFAYQPFGGWTRDCEFLDLDLVDYFLGEDLWPSISGFRITHVFIHHIIKIGEVQLRMKLQTNMLLDSTFRDKLKQQRISGEVSVFLLQTREVLSTCIPLIMLKFFAFLPSSLFHFILAALNPGVGQHESYPTKIVVISQRIRCIMRLLVALF
ncbi:hypothetical protein ACJX0J_034113, partial [Zea mays]